MNKKHGQFSFSGTLSCKRLFVNGVEITGGDGTGGDGATVLNDLTNVTVPAPNDNDFLRYNATSQTWVNASVTPGGGDAYRRKDEMIVWSDILDPPDSKEAELTEATTALGDRCEALEFKVEALPEIEAQLTDHESRITPLEVLPDRCEALEFKVEALPEIEARITETEEPPWSGLDPNKVLANVSSGLIKNTVADYAGWDTRKLLEELFKEVTGKWFDTVTIAFSTPTYTPSVTAFVSLPSRAGLTNATITPNVVTNIPTITASVAWPADATAAAQYGGTHQTWWQQSRSRHASAADKAPGTRTWSNSSANPSYNSSTGVIENVTIEQVAPASGNVLLNTYTASWSLLGTVEYTAYDSGVTGQATGGIKNNYGTVTSLGTAAKTWTLQNVMFTPYLKSWKKVGSNSWTGIHTWYAGAATGGTTHLQNGQYHEVTIPAGERTTTTFRIWGTWDGTDGGASRKVHVQVKVVGSWLTYSFTSSGESLPSTPPSSGVTWTNASDTDANAPAPTSGATGGATWTEFGPFTGGGSALEVRYGYGSF